MFPVLPAGNDLVLLIPVPLIFVRLIPVLKPRLPDLRCAFLRESYFCCRSL
jgi:hypothetical protein